MDLRLALNAISDVVNNRPRPLREFDQIYMKSADMLLQTEHVSRWVSGRRVIFMGDGDAIGLCLVHLHNLKILEKGPATVHVLDFDERIVNSITTFAERYQIADRVTAELYNAADPLPQEHWQAFGAFYTNPPFGKSNGGASMRVFCERGMEAIGKEAIGCVVAADDQDFPWSQEVLFDLESQFIGAGFTISELIPTFHRYHLDDAPNLTSCSIVVRRVRFSPTPYSSRAVTERDCANFYGGEAPLRYRYVRDLTSGGKLGPTDYKLDPL
jgi:predicted methyltransferase